MSAAESTAEVVGRHVQAFFGGDIETVMADFADDALLCTPDGALRGHDAIRGFFEQVLPLFPPGSTTLEVTQQIVDTVGEFPQGGLRARLAGSGCPVSRLRTSLE